MPVTPEQTDGETSGSAASLPWQTILSALKIVRISDWLASQLADESDSESQSAYDDVVSTRQRAVQWLVNAGMAQPLVDILSQSSDEKAVGEAIKRVASTLNGTTSLESLSGAIGSADPIGEAAKWVDLPGGGFRPTDDTSEPNPIAAKNAAIAKRFNIPADAVASILNDSVETLQQRDNEHDSIPNNGTEPYQHTPYPMNTAMIDGWKSDAGSAYVSYMREFDPHELKLTERENDVKHHPTVKNYTQWAKDGIVPPPVFVAETDDGTLQVANRRRTMAARAAGRKLQGWFGPRNPETGSPLKYGDIIQAAAEYDIGAATQDRLTVGDEVQWTSQGVDRFPEGARKIRIISDDGQWAFVEGTNTGIPVDQLSRSAKVSGQQAAMPAKELDYARATFTQRATEKRLPVFSDSDTYSLQQPAPETQTQSFEQRRKQREAELLDRWDQPGESAGQQAAMPAKTVEPVEPVTEWMSPATRAHENRRRAAEGLPPLPAMPVMPPDRAAFDSDGNRVNPFAPALSAASASSDLIPKTNEPAANEPEINEPETAVSVSPVTNPWITASRGIDWKPGQQESADPGQQPVSLPGLFMKGAAAGFGMLPGFASKAVKSFLRRQFLRRFPGAAPALDSLLTTIPKGSNTAGDPKNEQSVAQTPDWLRRWMGPAALAPADNSRGDGNREPGVPPASGQSDPSPRLNASGGASDPPVIPPGGNLPPDDDDDREDDPEDDSDDSRRGFFWRAGRRFIPRRARVLGRRKVRQIAGKMAATRTGGAVVRGITSIASGGGAGGAGGGIMAAAAGGGAGGIAAAAAGLTVGFVAMAAVITALLTPALMGFARRLNESNRELAKYNGSIAAAFNDLDLRRIQNKIELGGNTSATASMAARSVADMEDAAMPINTAVSMAGNMATALSARTAELILDTVNEAAGVTGDILKTIDKHTQIFTTWSKYLERLPVYGDIFKKLFEDIKDNTDKDKKQEPMGTEFLKMLAQPPVAKPPAAVPPNMKPQKPIPPMFEKLP